MLRRSLTVIVNGLWLLACLPGWIGFFFATFCPHRSQQRIRRRLLRRSRGTEIRGLLEATEPLPDGWGRLPVWDYEQYRPLVGKLATGNARILFHSAPRVLEPTGGSSLATKFIPYNRELQREFGRAIAPWVGSIFLRHPSIMLGRQYWAISPTAAPRKPEGYCVPVGFLSDDAYLGWVRRMFSSVLAVVPKQVRAIRDGSGHRYVTALSLMRAEDLSLVSVWHPSFFLLILECIEKNWTQLCADVSNGSVSGKLSLTAAERSAVADVSPADPRRAKVLSGCVHKGRPDFPRIWPRLKIISCWDGPQAEQQVRELKTRFPGVHIQGKGLLATEGVISIPFGPDDRKVAACRSHFLEFRSAATGEIIPLWRLRRGGEYSVILTTGNGFFRYGLKDRVRVSGYYHGTPCFEFLGKEDQVSDMVGEKIDSVHAGRLLSRLFDETGLKPEFAMLAPSRKGLTCGYLLFLEATAPLDGWAPLARSLEEGLMQNYAYACARKLGQIRGAGIYRVTGRAYAAYTDRLLQRGMKLGDVKVVPLHPLTDWEAWFPGEVVA